MARYRSIFMLAALLAFCVCSAMAQAPRYVVGILPVYDESAETLTENLPSGLTMLLYTHLREVSNLQPVLVAPGGLYDPESRDWLQEFGRKSHVDALLIARLRPTIRINERKRKLNFTVELMNVSSGEVSQKMANTDVEVATSDLFNSAEHGFLSTAAPSGFFDKLFMSPEDFEKQKIGAASLKLVNWSRDWLEAQLPRYAPIPSGSVADPFTPACAMSFRVRYVTKRGIAKGYGLLINNTDQSTSEVEGVAKFSIAGGPLVARVIVPDPPYGLPMPKLYMVSTDHSCTREEHLLTMEVGAAGEAYLRWE